MRRVCVSLAAAVAGVAVASGQAVSEWRTPRGLPVAVVEVAGGDVEHLAALLPADAAPPATVGGFPAPAKPRRSGQLWSVTAPSLAAQPVVAEFLAALAAAGSGAFVALGPLPARDIQHFAVALAAIPLRTPARTRCVVAEGGVEERRGDPDAVELALALPAPDDPRADLTPALLALVRTRLAPRFPDLRVDADLADECARLVLRVPARDETPRTVLQRLRHALGQIPATAASDDEVARALAACQSRPAAAAVAGAPVAAELAERLAFGGAAAGALTAPALDGATLTELARSLLSGHPGYATLVEREQRPDAEPARTLANGVEVTTRRIPGETGVVAVALGGVSPRAGREILAAAAAGAAREGWLATVAEIAGVPTVAVVAPAAALPDAVERLSESLSAARPAGAEDLETEAARALGLADALTAETLSVGLAAPPEVETAAEAVAKFFGSFPSGQVSAGIAPARRGLTWNPGAGAPRMLAVAELPSSAAGLVGFEVVRDRLGGESDVRVTAVSPPGRLVLAVACEGGTDVPALDGRLAALWKRAVRPVSAAEAGAAARRALAALFGDAARATARAAAATFLPFMPSQADLLGTEAAEVTAALAALPAWEGLTRFASGAAPPASEAPERGVRKSRSPHRPGR